MKDSKKTGLSFLRVIRNITSPIIFFIVLYILFNNLFMFKILNPSVYLTSKMPFDTFLKNYISSSLYYVYPIVLISATFTMLLLAALRLYRRSGAVISILIFTLLLSAYPAFMLMTQNAYKLDFRRYKPNKEVESSNMLSNMRMKSRYITTLNNYSVYVQDSFDSENYKNALLNKVGVNEPVYIADILTLENNVLELRNLAVIDNKNDVITNFSGINIKFGEGIKDSIRKSISGFHILEPINMVVYKFMSNGNTLYAFILFFSSLFLFFLSSYLVVAALSSPMHILHNILTVVLTYYVFIVSFYFISMFFNIVSIIETYSILKLSLFVLAYDIIAIIFSMILRGMFNFNQYYSSERT